MAFRNLLRLLRTNSTRCSSTTTYFMKPMPSKSHLHSVIPDEDFPKGYLLSGIHVGVKKTKKPDLGLILSTSPHPTSAAACLTENAFTAAPVQVTKSVLEKNGGRARAVVVNSGCANAVTGKAGLEDAWAMTKATDSLLSPSGSGETLVMSTGVIGQNLPIKKIINGITWHKEAAFGNSFAAWENVARAFMTTDTFPKLRARRFTINGKEYRMAGMDKGAGMIHPKMGSYSSSPQLHATLLGCILTDAAVSPSSLQKALTYACDRSFNCISVDGDMSTNDTIVVLANGAASDGAEEIDEAKDKIAFERFRDELTEFAVDLAQLVVRDGEGATKFVTVDVHNAATFEDARNVASRISTSALVKTALYGEDANWGRILAAVGSLSTLSTPVIPSRVSVAFVPVDGTSILPLLVNGEPEKVDEHRAKEILTQDDLQIQVDLGLGNQSAKFWTCDFSYEYVRINGDYRS